MFLNQYKVLRAFVDLTFCSAMSVMWGFANVIHLLQNHLEYLLKVCISGSFTKPELKLLGMSPKTLYFNKLPR